MNRINFDDIQSPEANVPNYYKGNGMHSLAGEADLAPPALPPRKGMTHSGSEGSLNGRASRIGDFPEERPPALPSSPPPPLPPRFPSDMDDVRVSSLSSLLLLHVH